MGPQFSYLQNMNNIPVVNSIIIKQTFTFLFLPHSPWGVGLSHNNLFWPYGVWVVCTSLPLILDLVI